MQFAESPGEIHAETRDNSRSRDFSGSHVPDAGAAPHRAAGATAAVSRGDPAERRAASRALRDRVHPDLAELYRTLIFYLREHRVSVAPILETAIVTSVNHLNLLGPTSSPLMILAITGLLLVRGILLAMDRWQSRRHNDGSHNSAH